MSVTVHHGDSREVLKGLADASVDSCVCDPPYALTSIHKRFAKVGRTPGDMPKAGPYARASAGFMGQKWDTGETAFDPEFWAEVYRVLKPGAHVVAFSGTRTYHRLACAIEDAGFEIRDMVAWLYGSGFPKSHDVSKGIDKAAGAVREVVSSGAPVKRMIPGADQNKAGWEKTNGREFVPTVTVAATEAASAWEGWGTALKPALEPVVLARKPLGGTVAANVLEHGTGALNIDASRVATGENLNGGAYQANPADRHDGDESWRFKNGGRAGLPGDGRVGAAAGMFQPGKTADSGYVQPTGRWPANVIHDGSDEVIAAFPQANGGHWSGQTPSLAGRQNGPTDGTRVAEDGSAARFFYTAKADAEDRLGSKHPTVKPVDLMAWLCRLVTPPGGLVLDPFAGTGTTGLAAMREGFDCILIEREATYYADIQRRLAWARGEGRLTAQETSRVEQKPVEGLALFGDAA